jgi:hypothetical protein
MKEYKQNTEVLYLEQACVAGSIVKMYPGMDFLARPRGAATCSPADSYQIQSTGTAR